MHVVLSSDGWPGFALGAYLELSPSVSVAPRGQGLGARALDSVGLPAVHRDGRRAPEDSVPAVLAATSARSCAGWGSQLAIQTGALCIEGRAGARMGWASFGYRVRAGGVVGRIARLGRGLGLCALGKARDRREDFDVAHLPPRVRFESSPDPILGHARFEGASVLLEPGCRPLPATLSDIPGCALRSPQRRRP